VLPHYHCLEEDETMNPVVSVALCVRNEEKHIRACLKSILNQSFSNFEIIIVDDVSSDNTLGIIQSFADSRIKYFRNEVWLGISKSRNKCIKNASGEFVFFVDGDCVVLDDWIEQGLKLFLGTDCIGVEGKIFYVSKTYQPTFSDHAMENREGGHFMTGNIAYRKSTLEKVNGFDESYTYFEDRDLAFRAMKFGRIIFNPEMVVYHSKTILTPAGYLSAAKLSGNRVKLFKNFGERKFLVWRIFFPSSLAIILFPPLALRGAFSGRFKTPSDYRLLPFVYVRIVCERINLWKQAAKEKIFVI
jgi:glycosyltransferase involved in cell wall biosynthesis